MSDLVTRRRRLPPEVSSPAEAREVVSALLEETGLHQVRDEALLLTSELVTNAVIHAGTDVELEAVADAHGLYVAVTDFARPSPALTVTDVQVSATTALPQLGTGGVDGGRGLLLVNQFASRWGTAYEPGGRTVWFRLDAVPPRAGADGYSDRTPRDAGNAETLASLSAKIYAVAGAIRPRSADDRAHGARKDSLAELVTWLAKAIDAATAAVTIDRGDGNGPEVVARYAAMGPAAPGGRTLRIPLALTRPWTGEFTASGAIGRHAEPIATLAAGQLALLLENERLTEAHRYRRSWLLYLANAGELLAQSMSVELTVALIPRLVVPRLGMWCAVHLLNEYGELRLAAASHADEAQTADLTKRLGAALPRLQQVIGGDGFMPVGSPPEALSYPLSVRGEPIGTLTVGRPAGRVHTSDELAVTEDLARRAALAIDNARIHTTRSRIVTTLQRPLLPPALPYIDGLEVAAQYVPVAGDLDVGGDFYDMVELAQQRWMLVVGDVSGKGVGAAAVTGLVRDVLHTLALERREPLTTLRRLNAALVERGNGYFCTLALAYLTESGPGAFDLDLHLAGHEQPVLLRADGSTSLVGSSGTALGLMDSITAPRARVRLGRGDSLVFYTDGVTERRRGRTLFGHHRLRRELSTMVGAPAAALVSHLRSAVVSFSSIPPRDDIAIVALRAV
ncbi:MAG TPA: SpoIIE family protein phosphatase [Micromonosporaceae bacterium]|nr:SpoIIE family protein phosphatase [Micromonosporaceae bacterium]